jgi:hypothetical protein
VRTSSSITETALRRIHDDKAYDPPNLDKAFREYVRGLSDNQIPPRLAYFEGTPAGKPVTP